MAPAVPVFAAGGRPLRRLRLRARLREDAGVCDPGAAGVADAIRSPLDTVIFMPLGKVVLKL